MRWIQITAFDERQTIKHPIEVCCIESVCERRAVLFLLALPLEHQDSPCGFDQAGQLAEKCGAIGGFVEDERCENDVCDGRREINPKGLAEGQAYVGRDTETSVVVQHGLGDVDRIHQPFRLDESGSRPGKESGPRADVDHRHAACDAEAGQHVSGLKQLVAFITLEPQGIGGVENVSHVAAQTLTMPLVTLLPSFIQAYVPPSRSKTCA